MAIETLDDWNARLACCCEMPACPVPVMECQSKTAEAEYSGYLPFIEPAGAPTDLVPRLYGDVQFISGSAYSGTQWLFDSGPGTYPISGEQKIVQTYSFDIDGVGSQTRVQTGNTHDEVEDTCTASGPDSTDSDVYSELVTVDYVEDDTVIVCEEAENSTTINYVGVFGSEPFLAGCPGPFAYGHTEAYNALRQDVTGRTLTDPKTPADLISEATLPAWGEPGEGSLCEASASLDWPTIESLAPWPECSPTNSGSPDNVDVSASARAVRFRWKIPDTHLGTYFKITWDIIEEPEGWDADPPTALRSYVSEDNTWEWTGPGDPEDPDSWLSPWYEIDPPSVPGTRRVVNIRFECYRSTRYGNKPQTTGEGVTLLDP